MRKVHAGVSVPHMRGHMLAHKIMRIGYFWLTMETDCCQFVQRCPECQIHGDLIHVPPLELHALASPWPFSVWGIDIIGKILPKSSSGYEFILVAIDYFTKWHHRSFAYKPQTNGVVEAANKNIKRTLWRMVETSRDWREALFSAAWLMDLDANRFSEPTNVDQLKRYYLGVQGHHHFSLMTSSRPSRLTFGPHLRLMFKVTILSSFNARAIILSWRAFIAIFWRRATFLAFELPLSSILGVQSHVFSLAFRATIFFSLAFRAVSSL
ncbi:hypothetical protein AAG906_005982 [Vitis piasezkii]